MKAALAIAPRLMKAGDAPEYRMGVDKNLRARYVMRDPTATSHVYVVLQPTSKAVKVGFTAGTILGRIASLESASPESLEIIFVFRATRAFEQALHCALKQYHLRGEWFRWCPEARAAIEAEVGNYPVSCGVPGQRKPPRLKGGKGDFEALVRKLASKRRAGH